MMPERTSGRTSEETCEYCGVPTGEHMVDHEAGETYLHGCVKHLLKRIERLERRLNLFLDGAASGNPIGAAAQARRSTGEED